LFISKENGVLSLWRAGLMGVAQIGKCPVSGPRHRKCWMMPLSQFFGDRSHGYRQIVTPCWLTFTTTESRASPWPIHQLIRHPMRSCILLCFFVRCIYICPTTSIHPGTQAPNLCGHLCALLIVFVQLLCTFCLKGWAFHENKCKSAVPVQKAFASTTFSHNYMLVISLNYSRPIANAKI